MDSLLAVFFDLQFPTATFKQVIDVIQIKLNEADSDSELTLVQTTLNGVEDILD